MSIRHIFLPLTGNDTDQALLQAAHRFGQRFDAHIQCVHVKGTLLDNLPDLNEGMTDHAISTRVTNVRNQLNIAEEKCRAMFKEYFTAANVPITDDPKAASGTLTAEWKLVEGRTVPVIGRYGRVSDVSVISPLDRPSGSATRADLETALIGSGRPILMIPQTVPRTIGAHVFIAWNRSAQAARAVAAAMPIIEQADQVTIAHVETGAKEGPSAEELQTSLAWHGIDANVRHIAPGDAPVPALLLTFAENEDADLIVMGAYSHSRLREYVLGGVTNHVLKNSILPVFMAH